MRVPRLIPELPLLWRELTELSARKRTYVIRSIGAIVILSAVLLMLDGVSGMAASGRSTADRLSFELMGVGSVAFPRIVSILFLAVELLMPAFTCGAIAMEKERNTLGTLFVTRLSPITIVLEKLGSRLIPMLTILLLTFPVLAFVYSLGGVESSRLYAAVWLLFWESVLYASIGLLCSAWYSTTVAAFVASYVLTGFLIFLTFLMRLPLPTPQMIWQAGEVGGYWLGRGRTAFLYSIGSSTGWGLVLATLPVMVSIAAMLLLTRSLLFRRAFVGHSSMLLKIFRVVDNFFQRLNDRAGGVMIIPDRISLPGLDPVAWREREKKTLGKARYLVRVLMVFEFPVMFLCITFVMFGDANNSTNMQGVLLLMWAITGMMVAVKAATLISSERTRETLDALLSTSITNRELLLQKILGMRRLMLVMATPLLSVHLTLFLMHCNYGSWDTLAGLANIGLLLLYLVVAMAASWNLMHLMAWVSLLLGGRSRGQAKSVLMATILLAIWGVSSVLFLRTEGELYRGGFSGYGREYEAYETVQFWRVQKRLFRLDGAVDAAQQFLSAATYGSFRQFSIGSTYGTDSSMLLEGLVLAVVLGWHWGLYRFVRWLTLRMSPWILERSDTDAETFTRTRATQSLMKGTG